MGYLSSCLKQYYHKKGKTIIFITGATLSELSLHMWEHLNYKNVDSSVVSRVLHGKRLFTPIQLETFSQLLSLNKFQREELLMALSKDYLERNKLSPEAYLFPQHDIYIVITSLVDYQAKLFYQGKSFDVIAQNKSIQTIYDRVSFKDFSKRDAQKIVETYGYSLLLQGRSIAGTAQPHTVVSSLKKIAYTLEEKSNQFQLPTLHAYAEFLLADISYLQASLATLANRKVFQETIQRAMRTYRLLSDTHKEKLAMLRLLAASACYAEDKKTLLFAEKEIQRLLPLQDSTSIVNAIHLAKVLTKGRVLRGTSQNPFTLEEHIAKFFKNIPYHENMYFEISNLKTRLETFSLMHLHDNAVILPLIKRGLELSENGSFPRHKVFFEKQLQAHTHVSPL